MGGFTFACGLLLLPVHVVHFSPCRVYASGREEIFNDTPLVHRAKHIDLGILDAQKYKLK